MPRDKMKARKARLHRPAAGKALSVAEAEKYRIIADNTYDWEYWKGPDGAILYCSPSCERITGYSRDEFIADPGLVDRIVVPQDRIFFDSHVCRVMGKRVDGMVDFRIRRKDGAIRSIGHICAPVFARDGAYLGVRASNRDTTKRTKVTQDFIRERDLAQLYFELAGVIMVVIDADHRVSRINAKGCEVLGYEKHEIVGRDWFATFIPKRMRKEARDVFTRLVAGKTAAAAYFENPVLTRKNGERIIAWHNAILRNAAGQAIGTLSSGEDITERREGERSLVRSERKYRTIVETTRDGFWYVDTDGHFLDVNRAACRLLGYSRGELLRMKIADIEAVERSRVVARHIDSMRRTGGDRFETKHRRKDGRVIDVEVTTTFSRDVEKGEHIFVFVRDITARKRNEELLRDNMAMLRSVVTAVPVGLGMASNRTIEWVSGYFQKVTGYAAREIVGRKSRVLYASVDESERVSRRFYGSLRKTGAAAIETRWRRKDGQVRDIYLTGSVLAAGGRFPKVVFAVLDITERKRAEEKTREDSERFRNLFTESRVGAVVNDTRGRILMANAAFSRFLGYTEKELCRRTVAELTYPDDRQATVRVIRRAVTAGVPIVRYEKRYISKDGSIKWGEVNASLIRGAGGRLAYMIAQIQDITERKKAEAALIRSEQKYRFLLDSAPDAVLLADEAGRIVEANKKAEELFGRSGEELRRVRYPALHPPAARRAVARAFAAIRRYGIGSLPDTRILSKDAREIPVDITGSIVTISGKKFLQGFFREVTERKRAEEQIEFLARFPLQNPFPVIRVDREGTVLFANDAAAPVLAAWGASPGKKVPGRWRGLVASALRRAKKSPTRPVQEREEEIGGRIFSLAVAPVRKYGYVNLYGRDVTSRRQAEALIRASEERFRRFSAASGYGFAMGMLDGRLVFGNAAVCRLVGEKRPEDFTRNRFYRYYTRRNAERLRKEILPIVLKKGQWVGELPLRTARGNTVQTEQNIFLIRDARGRPSFVGNIITDITDRQKAQAAIAEWKKSYELIIAATGQVAYDYSVKTGAIAWGGDTEKVLGYPFRMMQDNIVKWAAKIHPDDRPRATALLDEAMKEVGGYDVEYRFRRRDGRYLWIHDRGFFLPGASGKAERMLGVMQDTTELKHIDEAKKELVRAVSHELKTPIGMSRMALDMLADAMRRWDMKKLQVAKGIIERNTERLDRDVENVLELFTLESIEALTHKARCSIRATVIDVLARVRYVADFKKVRIRVRLSPAADEVVMTKADLKALVYNMLDNGVKFTDKGRVTISTRLRNSMLELVVRDTGIGITPSEKARLFTTFFKAHPAMPGTGLGLAICRDIARRYGGTITVDSKGPGKGTVVTVRLPAAGKT